MKKRGMVEVQFNWIFVFILGALILAFFVGFVTNQKKMSDEKLAQKIVRDTSTILTQSSISSGKSGLITLIKPLEFRCNPETCTSEGCSSSFAVPGSGISWDTRVQSIFSPSPIEGRQMVSWSIDWSIPYRVTNFLYLTSPEVRYVFVGSPGTPVENIHNMLPTGITKELVPSSSVPSIPNRNNYKVKFIFYNANPTSVPTSLKSMRDHDVTAVQILPNPGEESFGIVTFYQKGPSGFVAKGKPMAYLGNASVLGAIFSENSQLYECNMKKAFLKLSRVSQVHLGKIDKLNGASMMTCDVHYTQMGAQINMIATHAQQMSVTTGADNIAVNWNAVKTRSHDLKIYSCPLVY
jgi:hypothetical protein